MTTGNVPKRSSPPGWLRRSLDQAVLFVFGAALGFTVLLLRLLRPKPAPGDRTAP
ncbi:MAG: hypothetical protein IT163_19690 [Bryobacterales bacterium]|nr:hypothetical protein [Bryobacterales bacterium]